MSDKPRKVMRCGNCGSDKVTSTTDAKWNVERQEWVLRAEDLPTERSFCHICDEEDTLTECYETPEGLVTVEDGKPFQPKHPEENEE